MENDPVKNNGSSESSDATAGDFSRPHGSTYLVIVAIVIPELLETGWRVVAEYADRSTAEKVVELNPNLTMRVLEDCHRERGQKIILPMKTTSENLRNELEYALANIAELIDLIQLAHEWGANGVKGYSAAKAETFREKAAHIFSNDCHEHEI